ncbi:MAG: flagellar protein [Lachnospiraceae bacterium]|nr:flagellar protein [Lachnospiraceae bacterium]
MNIQNSQFLSIEQLQDQYLNQTKTGKSQSNIEQGFTFQDILNRKTQEKAEVKFSKHASNRLEDRNITLTSSQLERLNEGTQKAGEKGINESLVLIDSLAFIVNIPNNTVVTAMDQTDTTQNVFTNIDGTVIM